MLQSISTREELMARSELDLEKQRKELLTALQSKPVNQAQLKLEIRLIEEELCYKQDARIRSDLKIDQCQD